MGLECAYCWKWGDPKVKRMDLHEIILPRQRGMHDNQIMIALMNKCNCGFVCRECHPFAEGGEGMERAIMYLLRYEGLMNVLEYLRSVERLIPDIHEEFNKVNEAWGKMTLLIQRGFDG
jgi:hypothetical protein